MKQMTVITYDCGHKVNVTGKWLKDWPKGVTIEDERGVVHYATHDRIIEKPAPAFTFPGMT